LILPPVAPGDAFLGCSSLLNTLARPQGVSRFPTPDEDLFLLLHTNDVPRIKTSLHQASENETRPAVGRGYSINYYTPKKHHQEQQAVISTALEGQVTHQHQLASTINRHIQHLYLLLL
jgi:hypothetical protein